VSERYKVLTTRIRQELDALEKAAARAKRAGALALKSSPDQDLYLDAAALNLHDFCTGLERAFQQIAAGWRRNAQKYVRQSFPERPSSYWTNIYGSAMWSEIFMPSNLIRIV